MNFFRKRWKWFFYGYVAFDLFFGGICGGFLPLSDLAGQARAQGPEPFPAQQLVTNKLWVVPAQPNPQQVPSASVSLSGNPGPATFFYWIVSNYLAGNSSPAGPFAITNAPNVLSGSNFDVVNFVPVSDSGITYDVLRTTTPVQPSGVCNCAVATGVSGGPVNDQSNSLNPYTVVTLDPNTLNLTVTSEVQSAGVTHAILRLNGVFVSDLSVASGAAINPTNNVLPKRLNATTFGDSAFTDNGTTVSSSEPLTILGAQPQLTLGANGGNAGQWALKGSTSGTATCTAPAVAGTTTNPVSCTNFFGVPGLSFPDNTILDNASGSTNGCHIWAGGDLRCHRGSGSPTAIIADDGSGATVGFQGSGSNNSGNGSVFFDNTSNVADAFLTRAGAGLLSPDTVINSANGLGAFTNCRTTINVTPVTVSTSTTNDQNLMAFTLPANCLNSVGRTLRIFLAGVYSTPAASTATINVKVEICSVSGCGSGNIATLLNITSSANPGSVTNNPWNLTAYVTTQTAGAAGAWEAHGAFGIDLGAAATSAGSIFNDTNTATVTGSPSAIDTTAQNFLQVTMAFSAASASNSSTQRQLVMDSVR